MTLKLKLVTSVLFISMVETTNILRDACRSKLEINQLVLKKARRIYWTWARSSHFMWANSSSRLYWPSWSRAWSGPVVIALSDAQSGRLYWPNIGPILGLKVRFLLWIALRTSRAVLTRAWASRRVDLRERMVDSFSNRVIIFWW